MEWIKINSKEDLPAVAGRCQVKNKEDGRVETWYFHHSTNVINLWLTYFIEWRNITHVQQ